MITKEIKQLFNYISILTNMNQNNHIYRIYHHNIIKELAFNNALMRKLKNSILVEIISLERKTY